MLPTASQLSNEEVSAFCAQMAEILHAGISSLEGISLMSEDSQSEQEKKLLNSIYSKLLNTGSLYESLNSTGCFPMYLLNMVRLGEKTGNLDDIMKSLSRYYDRKAGIASAVKSAVTYPAVMIVMMVAVIVVLITKVLPIFNQVFAQLGTQMNSASTALMKFGSVLSRYSVVLIVVLCVLVAVVLFFARTKKGNELYARISGFMPFFRKTSELSSACQFAGIMSTAIKSGFSPEEGLDMAIDMNLSKAFDNKLIECRKLMSEGALFSQAAVKASVFSGLDARLITISAKSGTVDEALGKIADRLDDELQSRLVNIISTFEPTIIVILSCVTGIILLSVMLPLLGLLSGF